MAKPQAPASARQASARRNRRRCPSPRRTRRGTALLRSPGRRCRAGRRSQRRATRHSEADRYRHAGAADKAVHQRQRKAGHGQRDECRGIGAEDEKAEEYDQQWRRPCGGRGWRRCAKSPTIRRTRPRRRRRRRRNHTPPSQVRSSATAASARAENTRVRSLSMPRSPARTRRFARRSRRNAARVTRSDRAPRGNGSG